MTEIRSKRTTTSKWGWSVLIAMAVLLVINGVALFFESSGSDVFERDTGVAMRDVEALFPTVVDEVMNLSRAASVLLAAVGLLSAVLALEGFRRESPLAWRALWVLALTLVTSGLLVVSTGAAGLGVGYMIAGLVVAVALLVVRPERQTPLAVERDVANEEGKHRA